MGIGAIDVWGAVVSQDPILEVVKDDAAPLEQRRADAMLEVAAVMRRQAGRLPAGDDLLADFLESAQDYSTAAQLAWPPYGAVRPVAPPQTV